MAISITYVYLDKSLNQLFQKHDCQSDRIPQKGEVLQLKHTRAAGEKNYFGKVLLVVEAKHLWGFQKLEDCAVQLSKTMVYVQHLELESNGLPAYRQLLQQVGSEAPETESTGSLETVQLNLPDVKHITPNTIRAIIKQATLCYPTQKKLLELVPSLSIAPQATEQQLVELFERLGTAARLRSNSREKLLESVQNYSERHK